METVCDALETITSIIRSALSEAKVCYEFPGGGERAPIYRTTVATGVKKAAAAYEKQSDGSMKLHRSVTVEAVICAPKAAAGNGVVYLLDKILTAVMEADGKTLTLEGFSSSPISYSTAVGALILPAYITVKI